VRWCLDGELLAIFASCISSEPLAARFSTKATPCVEIWRASNLRRLRLGEEKRKKKIEEQTTGRKYNGLPYSTGGRYNVPDAALLCRRIRLYSVSQKTAPFYYGRRME